MKIHIHTPQTASQMLKRPQYHSSLNFSRSRSHTNSTHPPSLMTSNDALNAASPSAVGHRLSLFSIGPASATAIQPKLTINQSNDIYEKEADQVANQVMRMPEPMADRVEESERSQPKRFNSFSVQRKVESAEKELIQAKANSKSTISHDSSIQNKIAGLKGSGQALTQSERAFFEPRFGYDFSKVQLHTSSQADTLNKTLGACAFTTQQDIFFRQGEYNTGSPSGKQLLAHELTHVIQQSRYPSFPVHIQRYESGEHAELGETGPQLQSEAEKNFAARESLYTVKRGDTLKKIAASFKVSVADLKARNKSKLKLWQANNGRRRVEGFNAGEEIIIPTGFLTPIEADVAEGKDLTFTVNGVKITYGEGVAMGDFFENPDAMSNLPKAKLQQLVNLIRRERSGGKAVTTEEWEKATAGTYLRLAESNESHFAPPNAKLISVSGTSSKNHKTEWEKYHLIAIKQAQGGKRDNAVRTNAFADHFLTDAFAAGHIIHKRDLMRSFQGQFTTDKSGNFTGDSKAFFDKVAALAFVGDVKKAFSVHETVARKGGIWRPNISSVSRFSLLLQGIHQQEPDLLSNAVAKSVHDKLNTFPGGLPVYNKKGDVWNLSGDGTLNKKTRKIARKAVLQSQLNVMNAFGTTTAVNSQAAYDRVWDFVPRPTVSGMKTVRKEVKTFTTLTSNKLHIAMAGLLKANYKLILDELIRRRVLKRA